MTEEQVTVLLSHLEKIEKGFISELSHVKAEILALRGNVAIDTEKRKKPTRREELEAKIRASYK